jgi:hypothetical protein
MEKVAQKVFYVIFDFIIKKIKKLQLIFVYFEITPIIILNFLFTNIKNYTMFLYFFTKLVQKIKSVGLTSKYKNDTKIING